MAMIIRLERIGDAVQDEAVADVGCHREAAEVILFPGVRYERWSEEAAPSVGIGRTEKDRDGARTRARRDWLDI